MNTWKKFLPDLIIVVAFAVISFAYFIIPVTQGKILYRHDASAGMGAVQELGKYKEATGETTRWTNSIFSGMPTYQISPSYNSTDGLAVVMNAYHLWLPDNVWFLFAYMLGFYILLRAFSLRQSLAALGSIIWAFSSYFLIIIAAGHLWKVMALAYLPPMIAGIVLTYRGKYLLGFVVTAIFTAFEIKANHIQMTYYYLFIIFFMVMAYLYKAIKDKQIITFVKPSIVCLIAAGVGIAINISSLFHTWQYQKESTRGKNELVNKASNNQASSGLDREYITHWSYGIDETMTLLIPNAKGGASVPLSQNKTAMSKADPTIQSSIPVLYDSFPQYFGTQPGTSGPVYVGAFIMLLFIMGLFIVRTPLKWALLAATILSILLSWGKNYMWLTDLFIDYFPMYAKFRTVSSILVIAEFTIPLLAIFTLKEIIDKPDILARKARYIYISIAITLGVSVIIGIFPDLMGPFVSLQERNMLSSIQGMDNNSLQSILSNIATMRSALVSADAWRSVIIIIIGLALIYAFRWGKLKASVMIYAITVLCFIDMWQVDKRYLNDGMFVPKSERDAPQQKTATDDAILRNSGKDDRVLNFASNTFNENETSFFHKSIGGYNAAKLRRYQDIIDGYIMPEMQHTMKEVIRYRGDMQKVDGKRLFPVLNMLNTKFFIFPLQGGQTMPINNPYAMGNGWFINDIIFADNANKEYDLLGKIDLLHQAVADVKFKNILKTAATKDNITADQGKVRLDKYAPNHLEYSVSSKHGGIVVLSEIYYPGWKATIDGSEVEIGRANYILRAIKVPAGKHKIVFDFHPKSIAITETIAYIAIAILLLALIFIGYVEWKNKKKQM